MEKIDYVGFSAWLLRGDRRKTTIYKICNALRYFQKYGEGFTEQEVERFLLRLKEQNKSHAYINIFVTSLRTYGQYKGLEGLLNVKQYVRQQTTKATLSDDEIEAFLSVPRRKNQPYLHYPKMTMFWNLVAFTGARPGEIAKLQKRHVDWGRGVLVFEMTKTNVPGVVPIPPNCKEMLKVYMDSISTDYLFPSARGGSHYSAGEHPVIDNVDWHFDWKKRLAQMGGINRPHLTPYSFRHSMATRLLEENVSLFHVKKLMRHSKLETTEIYSHLGTKDVIEAVQAHPLIRKGSTPQFILKGIRETIGKFNIDKDPRFTYKVVHTETKLSFEVEIA